MTMKKQGGDEAYKTAASTLLKYLGNVVRAPDEDKFRNINLGNAAFQSRVRGVPGAVDFLKVVGFEVSSTEQVETAALSLYRVHGYPASSCMVMIRPVACLYLLLLVMNNHRLYIVVAWCMCSGG